MPDYLQLNEAQREAVTWEGGPLLVLAGPGSGKTFTIVKRISYLLERGVAPEQILVITFTKEAAASMQRRFQKTAQGFRPVNFGTFHSIFYHILKESHVLQAQRLLKTAEKINLMVPVLKKYQKNSSDTNSENLREDAMMLLSAIAYYKNTSQTEAAIAGVAVRWQENFWNIYREYERAVLHNGGMDFDDMLFQCRKLLTENTAVRKAWQKRFAYILIDEFQDINPVQYEILKLLSPSPHHIFAVGDDDQSIYGFRGSRPECLKRFEEEYQAHCIYLDINYRSRKKIIDTSLAVMAEGRNRYVKQLKSGRPEPEEGIVMLSGFAGKEQEQSYLVEKLKKLCADRRADESTAVLFRTNSCMQKFAAFLHRNHIPYRMKEQNKSIYEHFIVKDIMAYLLLAEGQENREYLLRIMNRPCRFISREMTDMDEASSKGMRQLRKQLSCMKGLSLPLSVTYVLKATGYERYLRQISAGRPEKWQEWQELLEWLKREAANYQNVQEWQEAQWLYNKNLEENRKDNARENLQGADSEREFAVQLMTVHASKGLEFDSVFIPDCNEGVFPYSRMPDMESVEEERRILYVAMTRAKESLELLYLTGTEKSPRLPSRFLNPLLYSSSSTSSSNSQLSRYSSKASATFSYSSSSSM